MNKLKMHSPDLTQANIDKLAELFPNCVVEATDANGVVKRSIDFDQLRQELSTSIVEGPQERYQINWPGKREALLTANAPIAKTLRPARAKNESVAFDTTQNLFIEGDNLDALKLLQETYLNKVKLIYIDPPYNTGKDFIYEDDFTEDAASYFLHSMQKDDQGNRLIANTESNGRFHSDWLSMLYPRLKLARHLLRQDGVIFISIGNDEVSNLRKICDEIFGEENFVECISWNKRIPKNDKGVGNIHDFILLYVKDSSIPHEFLMTKDGLSDIDDVIAKARKSGIPISEAEEEIRKLYKKQGYDRGITLYNSFDHSYRLWGKINMSWPNANTFGPRYEVLHPSTGKPVRIPDRGWRWKQDTFAAAAKLVDGKYSSIEKLDDGSFLCGRVWFAPDENLQPSSVTYLDEVHTFLLRSILSFKSDGGIEVEELFGGKNVFSYPKPTTLLTTLLKAVSLKDQDIVLDFFAGSCTTAHAVMALNADDEVKRRFIMCQLPEICDSSSEAFKAGYKNIAEISKERIRRAGKKIKQESAGKAGIDKLDIGFRVLKIDSSNMKEVFYTPDAVSQDLLSDQINNIREDRTAEDLLFQVLLDWGVDLALPIAKETIGGKSVYFVDGNALTACFDEGVSEEFVKLLAKREPLRVVFRDAGFATDSVKINVEQIFKLMSPSTEVKTI